MSRLLFVLLVLVTGFAMAQDGVVRIDETVTGNQELPRVLYIVPWKDANDNSILDERLETKIESVFDHIDRGEHQRQLEFIDVLNKQSKP